MLKKNRAKIAISSLIILLPILFGLIRWSALPDTVAIHWGADGSTDGFCGKSFAVFGLPSILLVLHFVCLLFTLSDKKQKGQSPKALAMVFWIIPLVSLFANATMYWVAFGREFNLTLLIPVLIGILFVFMGNYFPKIKQNRTLGIKVTWTLNNEENWNRTHRFAGKVWVVGGIVVLFSAFLPLMAMVWTMVCVFAAIAIVPIVYSYRLYRRHRREGVVYAASPKSRAEKIAMGISAVVVSAILIGVAVLMFTGNIEVSCGDSSFEINAAYWADAKVDYSEVCSIERRSNLDVGARTNGFGSARLSVGTFRNDEFGSYTLYAYTGAGEFIVLTSADGKTFVIGLKDAKDTQRVYETISERMGK